MRMLTEEREKLRRERDDALASIQKLNQENAALRQNQQRAAVPAATPASESPIRVPDLRARALSEASAAASGVRPSDGDVRLVEGDAARGTVVESVTEPR